MTIEITTKEAARGFSHSVNRVCYAGERLLLTRRGRPVAALVTLADLKQLEAAAAAASSPAATK